MSSRRAGRLRPVGSAVLLFSLALFFPADLGAANGSVTVHPPALVTKMTAREVADLKADVERVYPQALERVVAFVGTEKARGVFDDFHIQLRDSFTQRPDFRGLSASYCRPNAFHSKIRGGRQSITLIGQPVLTGAADLEETLAHEMLHVVFEVRYSHNDWARMPEEVIEGISYYGSGGMDQAVTRTINFRQPVYEAEEVLQGPQGKKLRERTFLYCFETVYGADARRAVVRKLFAGRPYSKAFASVTGEPWNLVRQKCDQALEGMLEERIATGGPYAKLAESFDEALTESDFRQVDAAGAQFLDAQPGSVWRPNVHWILAESLEKQHRYDEAIRYFERIRTGRVALGLQDAEAAFRVVRNRLLLCDCEKAADARKEFERFYPSFLNGWRERLDAEFARHCRRRRGGREDLRTYLHPNQIKESRGAFVNDRPVGPWTTWHPNGRKKAQGLFDQGYRVGRWIWWHDNARKETEGLYATGKKEGLWIAWHADGTEHSQGAYRNGRKTGLWITRHKNGKLESEGAYQQGRREGIWTFLHANNKHQARGSYRRGKRVGAWTFWYDNGQTRSQGGFLLHNHRVKKDGLWTDWHYNGTKKSEGVYKLGKEEEPWITWYDSGRKTSEGTYRDGRKVGTWTQWYASGSVEKVFDYGGDDSIAP